MADYTLQQLAADAGVTPRTIRYYIAQGLLPSPGAGSAARYKDAHLDRLRLIKQLQRNHLPLAEIRKQLDRGSALDYVQSVLQPTASEPPRAMFAPSAAPATARFPWLPGQTTSPRPRSSQSAALVGPPSGVPAAARIPGLDEQTAQRSQWDRHSLTPDVELHIRRPLTRDQNRRVDRLIALARELLQEDQP